MPQHARALAGAACALALSVSMFAPAAFADDAEGDGTATSRNAIFATANSIRGELGHVVAKQLRIVPELVFFQDTSLDYAEHIDELLKK